MGRGCMVCFCPVQQRLPLPCKSPRADSTAIMFGVIGPALLSSSKTHLVEHDVSLSDAARHLALYSLWYGLGGV